MNEQSLKPPVWVARPRELHRMLDHLKHSPRIAVDTESNSLFAYREQVCLIQFSTRDEDFLVDPLALRDLSALGDLFASADKEKIFHAAEYDLICLKRDFGFDFANIFDTMQAARILGKEKIGLADILLSEFGIQAQKRYQRANWGERPLSAQMLAYARLDTHYLIELRGRLAKELSERGLSALAQEDFDHLARSAAPNSEQQPVNCWRIGSGHDLSPQQVAVLQALIDYREHQAREANVPSFKVISNQILIHLAETCPQNAEELANLRLLSPLQNKRYASGLLQAIRIGLRNPPPPKVHNHRPDEAVLARIDLLKEWRKKTARQLGVESDIVLPRDVLEKIAFHPPGSHQELAALMAGFPWRVERFGNEIITLVQKDQTHENTF
ncbi:MAG: HRDC domain-containing protein [Bellilinea sp.]|jgi:ribonuclease D